MAEWKARDRKSLYGSSNLPPTSMNNSIYKESIINFKNEFRKLKFKIINDDYLFKIDKDIIYKNNNIIDFLDFNFKNYIISGSFCLRCYNLISRQIGDIDIIVEDYNLDDKDIFDSEYEISIFEKRIGHKSFDWKGEYMLVDIFKNDNYFFIEENINNKIILFQNPISIISKKIEIVSSDKIQDYSKQKHITDLYSIFKNLKK